MRRDYTDPEADVALLPPWVFVWVEQWGATAAAVLFYAACLLSGVLSALGRLT